MIEKLLIAALIIAIKSTAIAQLQEHTVYPNQTDTGINGINQHHYAYINDTVPALNKLCLFFPGTNALPWDYRLFQKTAANLGYHVIGLCYENLESINFDLCLATHDTTCHRRARYEVWFGQDTHDSLNITYPNSIVNRLLKLLKYLDTNYPSENWGQYLVNDSTVNWQKVTTAGHSQGAGHATFASKYFQVERVIMLSWTDWMWPGRNADWVTMPGPTPDSAYYGFIHTGDASIYYGIPTTWTNLGMNPYGAVVSIDTSGTPFNNTHSLITSAPICTTSTQTNFHNSTCVDWVTCIDTNLGLPVLLPVWQYLLHSSTSTVGIEDYGNSISSLIKIYPNPSNGIIYIEPLTSVSNYSIEIFNVYGSKSSEVQNAKQVDLSQYTSGLYFLKVQSGDKYSVSKIIKQ
jgi:hypothetical protein